MNGGKNEIGVEQTERLLDRAMRFSVFTKGIVGVGELIGGIFLATSQRGTLRALTNLLTAGELAEDPHAFIATHLVQFVEGFSVDAKLFGAVYLLVHGVANVLLAAGILSEKRAAYPAAVGVLGSFLVYQVYRLATHGSPTLLALTIFDAVVLALVFHHTLRLYRDRI